MTCRNFDPKLTPFSRDVIYEWSLKVNFKIAVNCIFVVVDYGGDETRSGYVHYVPVISANIPCTFYVPRDI